MSSQQRGRLLVAGQFLLIALIIFAPGRRLWSEITWLTFLGVVFIAVGFVVLARAFLDLGSALTANPVPKVGAPLQINGIYTHVRHPIYTGVLLAGLGASICRASTMSFLFLLALAILLNFKARWEESFLRSKHEGYLSYMEQVPRFLPRPRPNREPRER